MKLRLGFLRLEEYAQETPPRCAFAKACHPTSIRHARHWQARTHKHHIAYMISIEKTSPSRISQNEKSIEFYFERFSIVDSVGERRRNPRWSERRIKSTRQFWLREKRSHLQQNLQASEREKRFSLFRIIQFANNPAIAGRKFKRLGKVSLFRWFRENAGRINTRSFNLCARYLLWEIIRS